MSEEERRMRCLDAATRLHQGTLIGGDIDDPSVRTEHLVHIRAVITTAALFAKWVEAGAL